MEYIDYGLSVFNKRAFNSIDKTEFDLADIYKMLVERCDLSGCEIKERFYEIGSLEGIEETKAYIMNKKKEN